MNPSINVFKEIRKNPNAKFPRSVIEQALLRVQSNSFPCAQWIKQKVPAWRFIDLNNFHIVADGVFLESGNRINMYGPILESGNRMHALTENSNPKEGTLLKLFAKNIAENHESQQNIRSRMADQLKNAMQSGLTPGLLEVLEQRWEKPWDSKDRAFSNIRYTHKDIQRIMQYKTTIDEQEKKYPGYVSGFSDVSITMIMIALHHIEQDLDKDPSKGQKHVDLAQLLYTSQPEIGFYRVNAHAYHILLQTIQEKIHPQMEPLDASTLELGL